MNLQSNKPLYKIYMDAIDRGQRGTDGIAPGYGLPAAVGGNLNVTIQPVTGVSNGVTRVISGVTTLTLNAADPSNPRIDIIYLDTTGAVVASAGTPLANNPLPNAVPTGAALIAVVNVAANQTALVVADVTDARSFLTSMSGTLAQRPAAATSPNLQYTTTDELGGPATYRSDGTTWNQIAARSGAASFFGSGWARSGGSLYQQVTPIYYPPQLSTYVHVANVLYAYPFPVAKTIVVATIGGYISSPTGSQRMAIYKDGTDFYPGALVAQTAEFTGVGGENQFALVGGNVTLTPGLYWMCWWGDSGPTWYANLNHWSPFGYTGSTAGQKYFVWSLSSTYTAASTQFAGTFPGGAVNSNYNNNGYYTRFTYKVA